MFNEKLGKVTSLGDPSLNIEWAVLRKPPGEFWGERGWAPRWGQDGLVSPESILCLLKRALYRCQWPVTWWSSISPRALFRPERRLRQPEKALRWPEWNLYWPKKSMCWPESALFRSRQTLCRLERILCRCWDDLPSTSEGRLSTWENTCRIYLFTFIFIYFITIASIWPW